MAYVSECYVSNGSDNHVISREEQDVYAIQSFERGIVAQDGGSFAWARYDGDSFAWEIVLVEVSGGNGNTHVGGILSRMLFVCNFTSKAEDLILEGEHDEMVNC